MERGWGMKWGGGCRVYVQRVWESLCIPVKLQARQLWARLPSLPCFPPPSAPLQWPSLSFQSITQPIKERELGVRLNPQHTQEHAHTRVITNFKYSYRKAWPFVLSSGAGLAEVQLEETLRCCINLLDLMTLLLLLYCNASQTHSLPAYSCPTCHASGQLWIAVAVCWVAAS